MNGTLKDLRYGLQMLLKKPGFTLVAIITLALGVGANTAIFSVVNSVLLKPLPYPEPDRLMNVFLSNPEAGRGQSAYGNADFLAMKERNQSFEKVAALSPGNRFSLSGRGTPEQVVGSVVTADFFDVLRVTPLQGRTFLPDEDRPNAARTVIVSHKFWQDYLNSDPNAVGQTVALNQETYEVIGIMPQDFRFNAFGPAELWTTLRIGQPRFRPPYYLRVVGRLNPETSEEQAKADLSIIAGQLQQQYPNSTPSAAVVEPLKKSIVGDSQVALLVLLGAVLFIMLIASVNVANLLLARAAEREKEMAIRAALGASRLRLVRQALVESVLLALIGGTVGWLIALWGVDLISLLGPENIPRLDEVSIDHRVLGFTMLITLSSGLLFGLAPALQGSRLDLNTSLKESGRSATESFSRRRLRSLLVVSEIALALMLLVGSGLMIRSFLQLQRVDPGFNPDGVLAAQIVLPQSKYREAARVGAFHQQLLQRLQALPGVESASISMSLPPNLLIMRNPFTVEGQQPVPGQPQPAADQVLVSPDYFRTLGIELKSGRPFNETDNQDAPQTIIINETMARTYFPDRDPIGRKIQTGDYNPSSPAATVVGVVADVKYSGLNEGPQPAMYTPFQQNLWWRSMFLAVRAKGDPLSLISSIRNEVWAIDSDLPVTQMKTMDQLMSESVATPRIYTMLLGLFGTVAMLLATIGIYGVMSYTVSQRTREIGIRIALGARQFDVLAMVVKQGMKLALIGVVIGSIASLALSHVMASLLFGVSATDPLTFLAIAALLSAVALAACYIPAHRATKVDPLTALRSE